MKIHISFFENKFTHCFPNTYKNNQILLQKVDNVGTDFRKTIT